MSTERRPAKRARDEVSETPAITRSPDHWLEDGSIVLQAESTQFRIAKSTLANYSNVFRDMLSLRLPNDEPHVDGCPLVVLPGDSPVDWKYLLDAMNPKALFIKELPSLHQWAGILRLSKKYDIAAFRGSCVELFKSEYPSELYSALGQFCARIRDLFYSALPAALYSLASSPRAKSIERADFSILSLDDQIACLEGYIKMTNSYVETPIKWLDAEARYIPCSSCASPQKCTASVAAISGTFFKNISLVAQVLNGWISAWDAHLCLACRTTAQRVHAEAREEVWEKLPSYFGLPPWDELRRMELE